MNSHRKSYFAYSQISLPDKADRLLSPQTPDCLARFDPREEGSHYYLDHEARSSRQGVLANVLLPNQDYYQ